MLGWLLCNIYFTASNFHDMIDMKDNTMTWKKEKRSTLDSVEPSGLQTYNTDVESVQQILWSLTQYFYSSSSEYIIVSVIIFVW